MKSLLAWICLATLGAYFPATEDPPKPASRVERVQVPGTHVKIALPAGFVPQRGLNGFVHPEGGVSVIVTEMPGTPYSKMAGMFEDEKALRRERMKLVSKTDVKVSGRTAVLAVVTQTAQDVEYSKWIVLCGDERTTIMIIGVCTTDLSKTWSKKLETIVLDAEWDPSLHVDPFADLDWTVECPEGLRFAGRMAQLLSFSRDGEMVAKNPGDPNWGVGPSFGAGPDPEKLKEFSERRVRQLPTLSEFTIWRSDAVEVAGLSGWEVVGRAMHTASKSPRFFHLVILLQEGGYVIATGTGAVEHQTEYLPRFEKAARSWKPKPIDTEPAKPAPPAKKDK